MTPTFTYARTDVSERLAADAFRNSSFSADRRAEQVKVQYESDMQVAASSFAELAGRLPDRSEAIGHAFDRYKAGYLKRLHAWLGAESRTASAMIVGPAGFPSARNEKRMRAALNHSSALIEYRTTRLARLLRRLSYTADTAADREATYRARLTAREELQERMKAANKLIRAAAKKGQLTDNPQLLDALLALGMTQQEITERLRAGRFGGIGYASFEISNNGAEIRRLRARWTEARAATRRAAEGPKATEHGLVRVEEDADANRVRVILPGKPDEATRRALKSAGLRWAPSQGAWQRQLTGNALYAVRQLLPRLNSPEAVYQAQ